MPMKKLIPYTFLIAVACSSAPTPATETTQKPQSLEDSLYHEVIGYHDEAMPKMGKLVGYQKALQQKIDSLNALTRGKKDETTLALKEKYQQLQSDLKKAEKGMNDWMDSFEPDPKLPSKQELEQYWKNQQQKAKKMRDDMLSSIDSTRSVIHE